VIVRDGDTGRTDPERARPDRRQTVRANARGRRDAVGSRAGRDLPVVRGGARLRKAKVTAPASQAAAVPAAPALRTAASSGGCTARRRSARRRTRRSGCGLPFGVSVAAGRSATSSYPAQRRRRRRVHLEHPRRLRAIDMRERRPALGSTRRRTARWPRRRVYDDLVVAHGMDGNVWVLDRATGSRALALPRRLARRVVADRRRRRSTTSARGTATCTPSTSATARVRWVFRSGYKITSSASLAGGERPDRRLRLVGSGRCPRPSGRARSLGETPYGCARLRVRPAVGGRAACSCRRPWAARSRQRSRRAAGGSGRSRTGAYVYSSPAVWGGRVYFGSFNGVLYCVSAASGRIPLDASRAADRSPARRRSWRASRLLLEQRPADVRARRANRAAGSMEFGDGDYVPVSGKRVAAATSTASRCCTASRPESRVESVASGAGLVVLVVARGRRRRRTCCTSGTSRATSTVRRPQEFVTTEAKPPPRSRDRPASMWPMYGYDAERRACGGAGSACGPRYRVLWRFRAKGLVEFSAPRSRTTRLYYREQPGRRCSP
jgi:hypothetical protein